MLDLTARFVKSSSRGLAALRRQWPSLAWGLGLWLAVVVLPLLLVGNDLEATPTVVWSLAALCPLSLALAGLSGQPVAVMGFALAGQLPPLVACPALLGPQATGPVHALLVAVLIVGLLVQTWRASRPVGSPGLRRLWSRPLDLAAQLGVAWGVLALTLAWVLPTPLPSTSEEVRAARVAAVAVAWVALRRLPVSGRSTPPTRWQFAWRGLWGSCLLVVWWLWRDLA